MAVTAWTVTTRPSRIAAAAALSMLAAAVAGVAPWAALRVRRSERGTAVATRADGMDRAVDAGDVVLLGLYTDGGPGEIPSPVVGEASARSG